MQTDNKLFDDMAKLASGGVGLLADIKREIETMITAQMEKFLAKMNLVNREEFETVKEMAVKARSEQELLLKKIAELEAKINGKK